MMMKRRQGILIRRPLFRGHLLKKCLARWPIRKRSQSRNVELNGFLSSGPLLRGVLYSCWLLSLATPSSAQLPAPNEAGVTTGHVHYLVPDPDKHLALWESLGGRLGAAGPLEYASFPGIYVLVSEARESLQASIHTSANHIGFSVQDFPRYRDLLLQLGASIFYENANDGQILADLPDGMRVEILTDPQQQEPIRFHHMHIAAEETEAVRDWYGRVFGAEPSERRGLPSALIPGGRVDIMGVMGEAPHPSQAGVLHHIGFEVTDMDTFAKHLAELDIEFDIAPRRIESIDLTIAFVTDPAGTYIEITEGLVDLK